MITRREFVAGIACTAAAGKLIGQEADTAKKEILAASCGLYCGACAMYLATQEKDPKRLESVLKQGRYGSFMASVPWEDIQATSENPLFYI